MIEASIRKLGLKPENIKILLAGHAHIDHVGGHAYTQKLSQAHVANDRRAGQPHPIRWQGRFPLRWVLGIAFDPVTVDQVFQDGDVIRLGDVALPPRLTRAHTKRSTTFIMNGSEKCSLSFAREWCRVRWIDAAAPPR